MRGANQPQSTMFSYVSIEDRIPADHPLRAMHAQLQPILRALSPRFAERYSTMGRPSIPLERLLRVLLLQALYTIRSERQLMEQLDYSVLFRWFVGLNPDDPIWVSSVFSKHRERLIDAGIADAFLQEVWRVAETHRRLLHEHSTVDGTLLDAWASQKSVQPKDPAARTPRDDDDPKNPTVNVRDQRRTNETHASTTDPEARLARTSSGTASIVGYLGSVVMDSRHGLIVAQNIHARKPRSAIDDRTIRHDGYAISQPAWWRTINPLAITRRGSCWGVALVWVCGWHAQSWYSNCAPQRFPTPWANAVRSTA
ncbi:MAG: IS5 family transposase [Gemmatimonas sp.]|nr:IS5 family transposase [Gemmatimonas sp.]